MIIDQLPVIADAITYIITQISIVKKKEEEKKRYFHYMFYVCHNYPVTHKQILK